MGRRKSRWETMNKKTYSLDALPNIILPRVIWKEKPLPDFVPAQKSWDDSSVGAKTGASANSL